MLEVVQISYSKFRIDYELKLGSRIKKSELPFMQQKAYMEAVEDVFDAFQLELKLNIRSKGKNKSNISELNFETFYEKSKSVFMYRAKTYGEILEQRAYVDGAIKAISVIRLLLITLYSKKGEVQNNVKKPVPNLCIVWN